MQAPAYAGPRRSCVLTGEDSSTPSPLVDSAMERKLCAVEAGHVRLERCSYFGCGGELPPKKSLMCTKCRSVVYCSQACAAAAWTGKPPRKAPLPPPTRPAGLSVANLVDFGDELLSTEVGPAATDKDDVGQGGISSGETHGQMSEIERAERAAASLAASKRAEEAAIARRLAAAASAAGTAHSASAISAAEALKNLQLSADIVDEARGRAQSEAAHNVRGSTFASSGAAPVTLPTTLPATLPTTMPGGLPAPPGMPNLPAPSLPAPMARGGGGGCNGAAGVDAIPTAASPAALANEDEVGEVDEAMLGAVLFADRRGHKHECGVYVRNEECPYVGHRLRRYHEQHRRYATPQPTAEQLAPEYKPTGRFLLFPGGGGRWVEDDEEIPNPFAK